VQGHESPWGSGVQSRGEPLGHSRPQGQAAGIMFKITLLAWKGDRQRLLRGPPQDSGQTPDRAGLNSYEGIWGHQALSLLEHPRAEGVTPA
jgi:hypothetical protein